MKKIKKSIQNLLEAPSTLEFLGSAVIVIVLGVMGVIPLEEGLGVAAIMVAFVVILVVGHFIMKFFTK